MRAKVHIKECARFVLTVLLAAVLCMGVVPAATAAEAMDTGVIPSASKDGEEATSVFVLEDDPVQRGMPEEPDAAQLAEDLSSASRKLADELRTQTGEDATPYQLVRAAYLRLATIPVTCEAAVENPVGTETPEAEGARLDIEALEALRGNRSSSEGITQALKLVLEEFGLPVLDVEAADQEAREAKGTACTWVLVQIGDLWYHVDAASAARALEDARATGVADARPSLAWLLLSDEDLRDNDDSRYPWVCKAVPDAEDGVGKSGDGNAVQATQEPPAAPETYVFDKGPVEEVFADEPSTEETAADEATDTSGELSQDLVGETPEEEPVLHTQATRRLTLSLDNTWQSTTLSLGANPDAWSFTLTQAGTVTLSVKATDVDMHFSVHAGDSTSTTQYGSQLDLLAEYHGNVEESSSLTLELSKGTYYLIARDWASQSAGTYYVRGSFKGKGGSIANANVAAVEAQPYTGKPIKPTPKVTYGGATLKLNRDYVLGYKSNTKIGTAQITIAGKGFYSGSKTISFAIKKNITVLKFSKVKKRVTYTGKAFKPKIKVKRGSTVLKRNKHYTVTYRQNRNAGTASIVIKGMGDYAGSRTINFTILPRSLAKAKVSGVKKKYTYSGYALKPKPKVRARIGRRRSTLKLGRDYTLSYVKNIMPGAAKVVVEGKGNYQGKKVLKFKVVRGAHYYLLERDTWSFPNFDESIPLDYYTRVFGASKGRLLRKRDDGSGGTCYGMSTTVGAITRYGVPKVTSYSSKSRKAYSVYQVGEHYRSSSNGLTAHQFIQMAQIMQYDVHLQRELGRNRDNVNGLVRAARKSIKGGTPMVISFWWTSGKSSYGHAVVPLKVRSNSSTKAIITVYDSNTPGIPQTLTLYKRNGHLTKMRYSKRYGKFFGVTWSTPSNEVRGLMKGGGVYRSSGSANATLVSVSSDARLVADGGEGFALSPFAENDPNKVLHVLRMGGSADAGELYWVNLGTDRMGFTDIAEDATVSVATEAGSVDVDVSAGSEVVLDASSGVENTVVVDTGTSPDFQMTFTDADAVSEVNITGSAEGIVVGKQDGDVITLSGADAITVTSGNQSTGEVELDSSKIYQIDLVGHVGEPDVSEDSTAATEGEVELMVQMIGDLTGGQN